MERRESNYTSLHQTGKNVVGKILYWMEGYLAGFSTSNVKFTPGNAVITAKKKFLFQKKETANALDYNVIEILILSK